MAQIKAKVYYLVSTGEVVYVTSEMQGTVKSTAKEEDMKNYDILKNYSSEEIDYIELEYGTLASTFTNAKSYKVNTETNQLELTYYSAEELSLINQSLNSRVSTITEYLSNSDEAIITNVENSILETEKNKIINGGI